MMENSPKVETPLIEAWQIRAGRGAVNLSATDLGGLAKVSASTVFRAEAGDSETRPAILRKIQGALEQAGIRFSEGWVGLKREPS